MAFDEETKKLLHEIMPGTWLLAHQSMVEAMKKVQNKFNTQPEERWHVVIYAGPTVELRKFAAGGETRRFGLMTNADSIHRITTAGKLIQVYPLEK